jgi:hypothetical protein
MHALRTAIVTAAFLAISSPLVAAEKHDRAYWKAIVASQYALPKGANATALIDELTDSLGSTDPELRDAFGYEIVAAWIFRDDRLTTPQLEALRRKLQANLKIGLGNTGDDSIFLRSFSALDLSILAAYETKKPYLTPETFRDLLDATLDYLAKEKDVRGFDAEKGWMHATAHTADLLRFLGRSPKLTVADQARVIDAVAMKLDTAGTVFTHGEHERIARALLSLLVRADFKQKPLLAWIENTKAAQKSLWSVPKMDAARYDAVQNARITLRDLYLLVSLEPAGRVSSEVVELLRETVAQL